MSTYPEVKRRPAKQRFSMASFTPNGLRPFSLGGLPFELRVSLYQLVLEDTAPRIFELRLPSDTETDAGSAGPPRLLPNKGLKPPPILHAIPEARQQLLPQFVTSFDGHHHHQPADRGQKRSRGEGWLFHPKIDILFFAGKDMDGLMKSNGPFPRVQRIAFHPNNFYSVYFPSWASTCVDNFPDLRLLTLCLMSSSTRPLTQPAEDNQLVMDGQKPLTVNIGAPSLPGESDVEMHLDSMMAREFGAICERPIGVECRSVRRHRAKADTMVKVSTKVVFEAF